MSESPKVLIAIPACHSTDYGRYAAGVGGVPRDIHINGDSRASRICAVRETWWRDLANHPNVTGKFFFGRGEDRQPLPDEVFLDVADDYVSLPHKVQGIVRWALERDFDFLFKCDDDTFVWVDRLLSGGFEHFDHYGWGTGGIGGGLLGGPGYFLSKRSMQAVAEAPKPTRWDEDGFTAITVCRAGMKSKIDERFVCRGATHGGVLRWPVIRPDAFTAHEVSPEEMRALGDGRAIGVRACP